MKIFRQKCCPPLPEPRAPNGEIKEAEHHLSMAMESIQVCIDKTRDSKRRMVEAFSPPEIALATKK